MNPMGRKEVFLSYCWDDDKIANDISRYLKNNQNIELHRDVIDIKKWGSIKEYMQSIGNVDYIILLISDAYLKSANCMYEVLEVMRDRNYRDKIFPAIINPAIYKPIHRAGYVKYWENEFKRLEEAVKGIRVQNLGKLNEDLKRYQDISSNIAEFLDVVSDMNNPKINEVAVSIEEKLNSKGLLENKIGKNENDLFETLGIQKNKFNSEPTDLEVNLFMKESFVGSSLRQVSPYESKLEHTLMCASIQRACSAQWRNIFGWNKKVYGIEQWVHRVVIDILSKSLYNVFDTRRRKR